MKPCALASVFLMGCIGVPLALGQTRPDGVQERAPHQSAPPKLEPPSGPLGIGRVGYHWIDPARRDRYSTDPQAHRELMVYLWYPTLQKRADAKGEYFPGAKQLDTVPEFHARMRNEFEENWPWILSGAISAHAVERAPAARNPRPFPVVIFSHGNGSTSFNYTTLIEDLASRGYAVAAIEHTQTAMVVLFPDGRIVPFHRTPVRTSLTEASALIEEGAADVRFVLNRLAELNAGDAQEFFLAGRLDVNRLAAMGHSAGAEFAARACQLDPRLKACVDLDGGMPPISALPGYPDGAILKQPLLFLEADHPRPQMAGTLAQQDEYFRKKEEQLQSCPRGSYDVILKSPGIAHPSFSDTPLLFAGTEGYPETSVVVHNHELIKTFIRAFLKKNLEGGKAPLLDNPNVPHPEAAIFRYGH